MAERVEWSRAADLRVTRNQAWWHIHVIFWEAKKCDEFGLYGETLSQQTN